MSMTRNNRHTVLYISHGAGPLPILGDGKHDEMVANLELLAAKIKKPSAIIVVSAHWEESLPTMTGAVQPELFYDYYGFPQESYELEYPAMGDQELAEDIGNALSAHGLQNRTDVKRGFDHGMFIPLKIMYPEADIPCVQVSLVKGLDPIAHIALGEALGSLKEENLLIIGSGFSFHNMRAFFVPDTTETRRHNETFQNWLVETCANGEMSYEDRKKRLVAWDTAPNARYCHPREEHLLPLHVCFGAAGRPSSDHYELTIFDKKATAFLWQPDK